MKKNIKSIISKFMIINICLLAIIIFGFLLIYLSYKIIPSSVVEKNVKKSADYCEKIGLNPSILKNENIVSQLDTFTDSLMLLETVTESKSSTVEKALLVYRYNSNAFPNISLRDYRNNVAISSIISYPRYWHGYLIFLKPLLVLTDYSGILFVNMIFQILVVLTVLITLIRKQYYQIIIPYILLILSLIPIVIMNSIQYSSVWYIFNIGILLILLLNNKINNNHFIGYLLFVILGALTAYFDLLTYPLITFGIPAIVYFVVTDRKKIRNLIHITISWIYGYGIMWGSKWIIASIFTNENVLKNALGAANERVSSVSTNAKAFSRIDVLQRNFESYFNEYVLISLLVFIFILLIRINKNNIILLKKQIPLIIIAIYPIIWFLILGNHSYIHSWMTHKILSISYFAILIIIISYLINKKAND